MKRLCPMLNQLLSNGGEKAKQVVANYTPVFKSKEEYFAYQDSIFISGDRITYLDKKAEVKI